MNKLIQFSEQQIEIIKMSMDKIGIVAFTEFVRNAALEKAVKINKEK